MCPFCSLFFFLFFIYPVQNIILSLKTGMAFNGEGSNQVEAKVNASHPGKPDFCKWIWIICELE